jgi:hypothetical protein
MMAPNKTSLDKQLSPTSSPVPNNVSMGLNQARFLALAAFAYFSAPISAGQIPLLPQSHTKTPNSIRCYIYLELAPIFTQLVLALTIQRLDTAMLLQLHTSSAMLPFTRMITTTKTSSNHFSKTSNLRIQ